MGFHISQPGSSVATSLIDGESKPKHVLLLEIKVLQTHTPGGILYGIPAFILSGPISN